MTDDTQPAVARVKHEFRPNPVEPTWCIICGCPYDEYNLHPRPSEQPAAAMQASGERQTKNITYSTLLANGTEPRFSTRHERDQFLEFMHVLEADRDEAKRSRDLTEKVLTTTTEKLLAAERRAEEAEALLRAVLPAAEAEMVSLPYMGNSQIHEKVKEARAYLAALTAAAASRE